jgi:hypothetical protein
MTDSVRYSRKAQGALVLGFCSVLLAFVGSGADAPVIVLASWVLFLLCLVLGLTAWSNIRKSEGRLVGKATAAIGIGVSLLCIPLTLLQAGT